MLRSHQQCCLFGDVAYVSIPQYCQTASVFDEVGNTVLPGSYANPTLQRASDSMKPLNQITEPDERQKFFAISLDDLYEELRGTTIGSGAPSRVRELFNTARDLSLYSWFVYDFHPIAELIGFLALEAALRARAEKEKPALAKKKLRAIMNHAVTEGWITEEGIIRRRDIARARVQNRKVREAIERMQQAGVDTEPMEEPSEEEITKEAREMNIIKSVCDAAIDLRNAMAHGENLLSQHSHRRLRMTADLINQLFA